MTCPSRVPSSVSTSQPIRSFRVMAGPRDAPGDDVPCPFLEPIDPAVTISEVRQAMPRHREVHRAVDLSDEVNVDTAGRRGGGGAQSLPGGPDPPADEPADAWAEDTRTGQQRDHSGRTCLRDVDLQVVDVAHQGPLGVDDLSIQEPESGVVGSHAGRLAWNAIPRVCHWPAFVISISGSAATAAT